MIFKFKYNKLTSLIEQNSLEEAKEKIVRKILELTNWKMLVSNKYFCKKPQLSSKCDRFT
jgi:mRNA-degrading endonuclease HigB of HigAB toxin-antitoxin module